MTTPYTHGMFEGTIASRALALALLAAVLFGVCALIAAPILERRERATSQIAARSTLLARYTERNSAPASTIDAAQNGRALLLEGETDALRIATLQTVLRTIGTDAGWRLSSSRSLPPRQDKGLRLIGIEGRFTTTLAGLQQTLLALEMARPSAVVTALQITPAGDLAPGDASALTIRIDVYGVAAMAAAEADNGTR